MSAARPTALLPVILALLLAAAGASPADARSGRTRHHATTHSAGTTTGQAGAAHGQETANAPHVKAASEEVDKVLDSKIKNICRGC